MTDLDLIYNQLTERPIKSGQYQFTFDQRDGTSNLSRFGIFLNNRNEFGSEYLIKETSDNIFIRLKNVSANKIFFILTHEITDREIKVIQFGPYLEISLKDFRGILSKGLWTFKNINEDS